MKSTQPVNIEGKDFSELLLGMTEIGFQGRKFGEAFRIWKEMLDEEEITIFLGLSGAMIPAGMRKILSFLVKERFVDVIVSTGANLFHDVHEAIGSKHYLGSENSDDEELYVKGIDRIYDILAHESEFNKLDYLIADIASSMDSIYSSREFLEELALRIRKFSVEDSMLLSALKEGVPVFCPSIADSSIGIGLAISNSNPVIDTIRDIRELTEIGINSEKTGVIYIGGGVPKNFIQQTEVVARLMEAEKGGHDYAIQITTDVPQFGGLSGCTFEEGVSWGKISSNAKKVQVNIDATIALPILAYGLQKFERKTYPVFNWADKFEVTWRDARVKI